MNLINDVSHEPNALAPVKLVNNCTAGQFKQWTYFLVHGGARDFGWLPKCFVDSQYTYSPPPSRTQYETLVQEPTAPTPAQRASVDEVCEAGCQERGKMVAQLDSKRGAFCSFIVDHLTVSA